jgi:hypothetical protein
MEKFDKFFLIYCSIFALIIIGGILFGLYLSQQENIKACHTCGFNKVTDSSYNSDTKVEKIYCDNINQIYYYYNNISKCDKWDNCYNELDIKNPVTVCSKWPN